MARVKPGGWALNEKLSSADTTQLDINTAAVGTTVYETGVRRVETYGDAASLRLAAFADGDVVYLDRIGFFSYSEFSSAEDNGVSVIKPTSVDPLGGGRWFAINYNSRNVPRGVAGLDSQGRSLAGQARYGTVHRDVQRTSHAVWSRANGQTGVFPSTVITAPTCQTGDIIVVRYNLAGVESSGTAYGSFQVSMSINGGNFSDVGAPHRFTNIDQAFVIPVAVEASAVLPGGLNGVPVIFRLTGTCSDGLMQGYADSISYDIEVVRP